MRSPAGPAARPCWPTSSGRACSWCRWMRCAAGGATTTCSPICCAPGCRLSSPAGCPRCTGPRPPGQRSMTWPMTRCGTRWPPGTPPGRHGWWSGTSRSCSAAARARPCAAGCRRCRRSRYAPVRACAWPRRTPPPRASGWKHSRPCSMTPSAPLRSAVTSHMNRPSDRHKAIACWPMSPPGSRSCAPRSLGCAVMPPARPATTGRPWPAERGLAEVLAERRAVGALFAGFLPMRVWYDLGEVQRAQGNLDAALATCRQALDTFGESSQTALTGPAHVGLAQVLYERNELTAALDHATSGVTLCRQLAFTPALATGLAVMARIGHAHGDAAGALEAMDEAALAGLSPQVITLFNPVPAQRARLLLAQGD